MRPRYAFAVLPFVVLFAATAVFAEEAEQLSPQDGETVTRPPTSLRVWLPFEPDVEKSVLDLEGPTGKMELEGLHTMGDEDLMVRIVGRLTDGEYTARWRATDPEGTEHSGEWMFTVRRGG